VKEAGVCGHGLVRQSKCVCTMIVGVLNVSLCKGTVLLVSSPGCLGKCFPGGLNTNQRFQERPRVCGVGELGQSGFRC